MPYAGPPAGYVDMIEAERMTGVGAQTITAAVKSGELDGYQTAKGQPWRFKPADLEQWKQLRYRLHRFVPDLVTTGRQ